MDTPEHISAPSKGAEDTAQTYTGHSSSSNVRRSRPAGGFFVPRLFPAAHRWLLENTFAPNFLSGRWSHPIFGYLAALLFQLVSAIVLFALAQGYPSFRFPEGPLILVILLVALGWGAGPSLLAMLVGAGLLVYVVFPPIFSLAVQQQEDAIGLGVYVAVGLTISMLASTTERARRKSEQLHLRLNTIIEAIPDSLVIYDPQGRRIQQNRVAREIDPAENPPLSLAEMPSQLATRSPSGEPLPLEALPLARALRGETVVGAELLYRVPVKQQDRLVAVSAAPLHALSGKSIEGAVTIIHDLTERKHTEETLRASEERYRTIVQTANEGVWLIDTEAHTLYVNERMAEMLGVSAEEMIGRTVLEFTFPEDESEGRTRIGNNLQGHFEQFDFRFRRKDGSALEVLACTSSVRDGRGEIVGALGMFTDVTGRKKADEVRLQLAALVESSDDAIIGKTVEGIITNWNTAAEQMYGYTAQEAVGQPITLIFPPDQQDEFAIIMEQITRGEHIDHYETRRVRKDGRIIAVSVTVSPIKDITGTIIGASAIARDITEQKKTHERTQFLSGVNKVLASTLNYQETLANIARLVVPQLADWFSVDLVDAEGHFELIEIDHIDPDKVQWAKELRSRFPLDPNATMGAPNVVRTGRSELYPELTDEMLVAAARNEEELAIARQVGFTSVMHVPLVARGNTMGVVTFVSAESGRRYDERDLALAEEVGRGSGVALDNARLYREVRQARDQLDIILQGVADGIIVYDTHSQIIYANEAAAQLTGSASVQAMLQTPPLGISAHYEIIDEERQPFPCSQLTHTRVLAGEREAQATIGYRDPTTGRPERWSFVKSRPVLNEQGEMVFVITIIHDLTERVQAEQRKDEFISMASHELKTPVTSLKGFTQVLQRRLAKQGDEQTLHFLARMDAQLTKLTKLISELLDISKMQSGKLNLQEEPFDLDALIQETVENMQAATSTHHLLVEGRAEALVVGDKDRLGQVFINLLTNAIKYSPQAETVIVRLSRDQDQEQAIISVQDFGIGIAETHQQKIFERFYRVTHPEERTFPGLGIGLYISHEIVERHHGRMWVESRKGEGATFSVALPLLEKG